MKPFLQADSSTTRKFGGTGLGLSISKSLIELMGGKLNVNSSKNRGSNFFFEIDVTTCGACQVNPPAQEDKVAPNTATALGLTTSASGRAKRALHVLIAEDYEMNQLFMELLLKKYHNITYHFANNGEEVIKMLGKNHYDLIFMDINMPVMDGIDATKIIKEELQLDIPIVALTANALQGDKEKYLMLGMDDYLAKPLEIKEVTALLDKYR